MDLSSHSKMRRHIPRGDDLHNNHSHGGQQQKTHRRHRRVTAEQHSCGTCIAEAAAVAPHARPKLPLANQSRKESPVAHEEARNSTISQADLLREADCVSSSSRRAATVAAACSIAHLARPKPLSAQQSRQGSTVGLD